jgi:hypothetical protein
MIRYQILIIIIACFLFSCQSHCDAVQDVKKIGIAGRILDKYRIKLNRNSKELDFTNSLSNRKHIYLFFERSGFWDFVQVGDSLYKSEDSFKIHVYRMNNDPKIFILEYGCKEKE